MASLFTPVGIFYMPQIYDMAGFEPAKMGTEGQHTTPRPPKPCVCLEKKLCAIVIVNDVLSLVIIVLIGEVVPLLASSVVD
jgi:hypothetical protein